MSKRPWLFVSLLAVAVLAAAGTAALRDPGLRGRAARLALFGSPLLEVNAPLPEQWIAQGGVQVVVRYPLADRTAAETFRCLLNGRDVTERLTRGANGAAGSVLGAVEGANRLRVEVFGRPWWGGGWFEDAVEITFHVRPLPGLDRA